MAGITQHDGRLVLDPQHLKQLRKHLGLSQEALAQRCFDQRLCVSIASIKRAESGKPVLYRTARHLATIYEVEVEALESHTSPASTSPSAVEDMEMDDNESRNVIRLSVVTSTLTKHVVRDIGQHIEQFGGSLCESTSATLLEAIFGVPRAYRSDALRCLQCATAISRLLANDRLPDSSIRLATQQWPSTEQTPLTAPDLPTPSLASTPSIWVEHGLAVQLVERFVFDEKLQQGFMRYVGPLEADHASRFDLIGRHLEVSQLKAVLETTCTYQTGHILYVRGVAGIGKTRLVSEFIDMAHQQDADLHVATVLDFGTRTDDSPLAQLLRSLLKLPEGSSAAERQLRERLHWLRLPNDHAMVFRPLLGLPQPPEHERVYAAMTYDTRVERQRAALRELILREAIERPQVLVIEDLHWADDTLFQTLATLLQDVRDAPVIWMLTSRIEQDPLETKLRPLLTDQPLTLIDLAPLRQPEAQTLATQFGEFDTSYVSQCVTRSQGNPLFLTQLLLFHQSGSLPASLKNLVQTKLDQLATPDRQAMRAAATIGQRFTLEALRALLPFHDYRPELPRRHYLVRPLDDETYLFVHDLIMQGIYESIPRTQRDRMHLRLAQYYAERDATLRAQHLHKARALAAPGAFVEAIEIQLSQHRHASALALLQQCQEIDYAPRDDYHLEMLHAQICVAMGLTQEARTHYDAARHMAANDQALIDACIGLARTLNLLDELDEEERLLDRILPEARKLQAHAALAEIYYLKGNIYFPRGDFSRCREYQERALEEARASEGKTTEIQALSGLGDSHYAEGHMLSAHRVFERCVALCRQHGHADLEASNLFMLGTVRIYTNDTQAALEDTLVATELGERVGNRRAEIVARLTAGWILLSQARPEAASQHVETGLELARGMGANRFEAFLLESQARLKLVEGQFDVARNLIRTAWQIVERHHLHHFIGPWVLGTLALLEERESERQVALEKGWTLLDRGCVGHNAYRFLITAAETCLVHGQGPEARRFAQRLRDFVASEPCAWAQHHIELIERHAAWLVSSSGEDHRHLLQQWRKGVDQGLTLVMPRLAMEHYGRMA
ncbi:hypothetical protein L861_19255 [Litchfieldella anticariensis FP35 = DSM 16096]|uniref:HTH cro/C1-type domain-containing protein n=1 Tax=Litchfieldella anticariensis (strain DSM 16096 / CECT 5854 / CIP 108499 / LMG 22089 / FP35) TaxID=1121939 RepID=S2KT21_LITA3|nr:AAA family ATPase [Halomonas anticariensis]EPC03673.1 hypothetical protein L861_19255 [Halomonas anticariensis FP35 = DSM 16096]